jgi:hypothetical protein
MLYFVTAGRTLNTLHVHQSRTEENVKKVTEILASDRCVSARLIEELLGISNVLCINISVFSS